MPCWDISDSEYDRAAAREKANIEAALCAVLTMLEKEYPEDFYELLKMIDWKEAGITKKWLMNWWTRHQARDAERRAYEAKERAKKERLKHLREKLNLTEEEMALLRESFHNEWMKS
jgi:glycogen synthase